VRFYRRESKVSTIAVFVDVQNMYYTCRDQFGTSLNYRNFFAFLQQRGDIVYAFAYAIERANDKQRKFQDALRHIGFTVKLKPFIQRSDGTSKGDWDVGITIDMLEYASAVDEVILLSGDGDFAMLLSHIKQKLPTRCTVVGVDQLTAFALRQSADEFLPIGQQWLQTS
jgi:uncharacterized LabA/DUF88 family protein